MALKPSVVKIKINETLTIGKDPLIIGGPCSIEDRKDTVAIANAIKNKVNMFRGGAFKPRTHAMSFQGLGVYGLDILKGIKEETGLPVISEVLDIRHLDEACRVLDVIQIGARNMYNYPLLKEAGQTHKPILLKRGLTATLDEWLGASEYIEQGFNGDFPPIIFCERGIRTCCNDKNILDLNTVSEIVNDRHYYPIIIDPSHGTNDAGIVHNMALAGIFAGADGVMMEIHNDPKNALSDNEQQLSLDEADLVLDDINEAFKLSRRFRYGFIQ